MSNHLKESEVSHLIAYHHGNAVCLGYCAAYHLLEKGTRYGYTCGVYGWNYDVYEKNGVVICTGYRRMKGIFSETLNDITAKYDKLAEDCHPFRESQTWQRRFPKRADFYAHAEKVHAYLVTRWTREMKRELTKH